LTPDERSTLAILDAQRDQAAHYYAEVSEDLLYIHAQSAVTLYDNCLRKSFSVSLGSRMPTRILPVSSQPPRDLVALFDVELAEVDRLLELGKRRGAKAAARLRSVLAFATGARKESDRVSEDELSDAIARRRHGEAGSDPPGGHAAPALNRWFRRPNIDAHLERRSRRGADREAW
jgi:hypothetical protein